MLSRVAGSVYWMSRYIERAENYSRFIDVNHQLMMDLNDDTDNYVDVSDDGDGTLMQKKWKRQFQLPERIVTLDWKTLPSCSLDKYIHKTGIIRCR